MSKKSDKELIDMIVISSTALAKAMAKKQNEWLFRMSFFTGGKEIKLTKWDHIKIWWEDKIYKFRHKLGEWIADDYFGGDY